VFASIVEDLRANEELLAPITGVLMGHQGPGVMLQGLWSSPGLVMAQVQHKLYDTVMAETRPSGARAVLWQHAAVVAVKLPQGIHGEFKAARPMRAVWPAAKEGLLG
jgi:hypothetical protein